MKRHHWLLNPKSKYRWFLLELDSLPLMVVPLIWLNLMADHPRIGAAIIVVLVKVYSFVCVARGAQLERLETLMERYDQENPTETP